MFYRMLLIMLCAAPLMAAAQAPSNVEHHQKQMITTDELKSWYDQNKPMVVIDARSQKYFDGRLLPNAKWLSVESTEAEITAAIPDKNSVVVVYCAGINCPASGWLYDKLKGLGYTNVYEYHEGIQEWVQKGYPVTQQ